MGEKMKDIEEVGEIIILKREPSKIYLQIAELLRVDDRRFSQSVAQEVLFQNLYV